MLSSHLVYRVGEDGGRQRKAQHLFLMLFFFPTPEEKEPEHLLVRPSVAPVT